MTPRGAAPLAPPTDRGGLSGLRVLVTGGASGIGAACVRAFDRAGARVAALDRVPAELPAGEQGRHLALLGDVTEEASVAAAVAAAADGIGGLDVLVGCAGVSGPVGTGVAATTRTDWDAVFAVNVTGQFLLVKHGLAHLRRSDRAAVVFLGSDSAFVAAPGMVTYCASKGALAQLTRALSVDLAPEGIRVCSVCPSIVDTPMSRGDLGEGFFTDPRIPVQTPDQVAAQVLHLADPDSVALTGLNLVADFGGLARSAYPA